MRGIEALFSNLGKMPRSPIGKGINLPERIFRLENGAEVVIAQRDPARRYVSTTSGTREMSSEEQTAYEQRESAILAAKAAKDALPVAPSMEARMQAMESRMTAAEGQIVQLDNRMSFLETGGL